MASTSTSSCNTGCQPEIEHTNASQGIAPSPSTYATPSVGALFSSCFNWCSFFLSLCVSIGVGSFFLCVSIGIRSFFLCFNWYSFFLSLCFKWCWFFLSLCFNWCSFFLSLRSTQSNSVPFTSTSSTRDRNDFQGIAPSLSATHAFEQVAPSTSTSGRSTIPERKLPYDVFINHRGPDVKKGLATDIYNTLNDNGLRVFLDSKELESGDFLPTEIEEAMRNASLHIAIFSQNYAQSRWCLEELSFMLKTGAQIVPVFYQVQPQDVRHAKGYYGDALSRHKKKGRYPSEKLDEWKNALNAVSNYFGHIINNKNDETKLLKNIVNCAVKIKKNQPLVVAKYSVGIDEAVKDFEMTTLQSVEGHSTVQIVGICGMGGLGKTTLAKKLYNNKYKAMEKFSFLFNVRDAAQKSVLHLKQRKLLEDLGVKKKDIKVDNIEEGKGMLATHLRSVRVLIVLDDVDNVDQLDALVPEKDNLRWGSLIVVTTRQCDVLSCWGISSSSVYKMKKLDPFHCRQLFCWHAFLQSFPKDGFAELVEKFMKACDGLPLSLKVFGGQLCGKSEKDYWESQLKKISRILPDDVKSRLRVSYDALDKEEKEAFLDAACFFIGEERSLAIEVWNGSEGSGLCSWDSLVNKCLLEVDEMDCIKMHDHLRDLGREISYEQSPYRLWLPQEQTINVEKQEEKRISIRGIMATSTRLEWNYNAKNEERDRYRVMVEVDGSSREDRKLLFNTREGSWSLSPSLGGLKFIVVSGHDLNEVIVEASRELVWLRWFHVGQRNLPSRLSLKNLRVLELYEDKDNHLEELWDDAGKAPIQLRELVISGCTGFQRLPESIGSIKHLKKIVIGDFLSHVQLKSLPRDFCLLQSLEHLKLCCPLSSLPDNFGDLRNLRYLYLCCPLSSLPDNFGDLRNLRYLYLSGSRGLKRLPISFKKLTLLQHLILEFDELTLESDIMEDMTKLEQLDLSSEKVKELPHHITNQPSLTELHLQTEFLREVPVNIGQLSKLQNVKIGSSLLTSLPDSLGNLSSLTSLDLSCEKLESLPDSLGNLSSLTSLDLSCEKLESLPDSLGNLSSLTSLDLSCEKLESLPESLGNLSSLTSLDLSCKKLESLPDSLGNLSSLTSLDLFCDMLKSLPDTLGNLSFLTSLDLSCEMLELDLGSGPFASLLCNLHHIKLRFTKVSKISISEDCCPGLETLYLFRNDHLTEIEVLPTTVNDIELRYCKILRNIRGIVGLVNIRKLGIIGCPELDELPSVAQFASAQEFEVNGCYRAKKIQGLEDSTALEELTAERLRKVQLIAISRSAIQPYIQTMKKWPEEEMRVCVRAVPNAASLLNSFAFENLSIVASLDNQIIDKDHRTCKLAQKWSHNGDAIIVCFVINCVPLTMSLSSKYIEFMSEAELEEGKWVWIAIFTQGFKWWREHGFYITTKGGKIEVEKAVVGVGEHRRVWEAFCGLWRDLPE